MACPALSNERFVVVLHSPIFMGNITFDRFQIWEKTIVGRKEKYSIIFTADSIRKLMDCLLYNHELVWYRQDNVDSGCVKPTSIQIESKGKGKFPSMVKVSNVIFNVLLVISAMYATFKVGEWSKMIF